MIGTILRDPKTNLIVTPPSLYQPPKEVKVLTQQIQTDYQVGYNLQYKPFEEFNDYSLLDRADLDQKRWNAYRAPKSEDPDEAWRWNGIRPITRNRIIGIVAQMTSQIIIPAPFAQNDKQEIDRTAALVMRDLMDYNIRNSDYVENYILWITDALVNPIAYLGVGFFEAMQTIKEENEGKISKKEVIDGVLSGFQTFNIPVDEVLIGNFYQKQLERQRFVIRKRNIEYDEAEAIYGEHKNWEFVTTGKKTIFSSETSLFYNTFDETLQTLCEEVIYYNRLEDTEIPFVNGIYLGDTDTEANAIKHRDNENRPKYNFATMGYEEISTRFFYYKSAAWKLGDDDELVVRTEQLLADAVFISTIPPTITTGQGQLSEAIVIPGKNTAFDNPDVRVAPIQLGASLTPAFNLLLKKEQNMSESTQDPQSSGVQTGPPKTAREALLLQENAKIALGRFGHMLVNSLKKFGGLMIDVIIQHQSVAEIEEISEGQLVEKWKSFVLTNAPEGDKMVTRKIQFKGDMVGKELTPEESKQRAYELLKQEGGIDSENRILEVNPEAWRKMKFHLVLDVKELLPPSLTEIPNELQQLPQEQPQLAIK